MTENQQQGQEWITEPVQARSQETLNRFLDAAEELLREQPFDEITVAEIVRRAERTVGSFYARFTDKDALIRTLAQRMVDELVASMRDRFAPDRWQQASTVNIVEGAVAAATTTVWKHAHVARAALMLASRDDDARTFRLVNYRTLADTVVDAVKATAAPGENLPSDSAIRDAIEVVTAVLDTRLLFGDHWRPGASVDLESEIKHITDICLRILNLP